MAVDRLYPLFDPSVTFHFYTVPECTVGFMDSLWTCLDTANKKGPVKCYISNQHLQNKALGLMDMLLKLNQCLL